MKTAIIGANGQLGVDLCRVLRKQGITLTALTHKDVEVASSEQVDRVLDAVHPDVLISTAAYHKVEECEQQPGTSFAVNATGPRNLALACQRINAVLVHFSTDYVFDGGRCSSPTAKPICLDLSSIMASPSSRGNAWYLLVGRATSSSAPADCTRSPAAARKARETVETMLKKAAEGQPIRVVNDQVLTPTFTGDLANAISQLTQTDAYGLYHISAEGQCSWYEFARKIFELQNLAVDLRPVSTLEFPSPVQRPPYSVLSKQKLKTLGISMPPWENSFARYLAARKFSERHRLGLPKQSEINPQ